jgi:acetyl/propionyl-CoA carboxylase alpha subunit/acetyl-CoA carboxylase carboxyltransferase component
VGLVSAVRRPLSRLAIVNRGEAAMRCLRAAKSLRTRDGSDLHTIAIYTDVDRDAPFVRHADEAIRISSPAGAVAAYLDHDCLMEALRSSNADAVWPGWGFVAEDPAFVERLEAAGVVFLGPPASAMRDLGDKIASKQLAEGAGVPVTAWSGGALVGPEDALEQASRVGYPLVVKASAGGGGRGIRFVDREEDLLEAFASARNEARVSFGDERLFCEKAVLGGRHIEVQVAGDSHGTVVSVGCRDCSVQRRNQKVLEEAPPPGLSSALREGIEGAAVRLAARVGYVGVGTVEFLVSGEDYYFLEMNPRLQVEHGITEEITGVDLVELQIRIARGESLAGLAIEENGVAIEARVCAEDPDAGFAPSPGEIALFDPALGPRIRVDSGVVAGSRVPPDFDSLIAKVIATGATREEARARLVCGLRDFELVVAGGATNKGYLLELLDADAYRKGPVDTRWLDRWNEERSARPATADGEAIDALVAAAILAYQKERAAARVNFYSDTARVTVDRIPPAQGQQVDLSFQGESYRLVVYAIGSWRYRVHLDSHVVAATMREEGTHSARLIIGDRVRRVLHDRSDVGLRIEIDGHPYRYGWQTEGQVVASTPAMVVAVHVEPGDRVEAGQALGLVEAMKMEIGFQAPVSGVVREVLARKGQRVAAGEVLLVIEPAGDAEQQTPRRSRLALPAQIDRLALLFRAADDQPLADPDLEAAAMAEEGARREAIAAVREEIRRVLLGYDANPARGESLVAFLEAGLPDDLSEDFRLQLSEIRSELVTFADIEELFIRAPRASVSGELGPSNNARFRMYVRRLRAGGAGIAQEFLDLVKRALSHYGIVDLAPSDALERAVLRMLSSQVEPTLRRALVHGMLHRIAELAESGVDLSDEPRLRDALDRIARMRGLLPDAIADLAIDARYLVFERGELERQSEQSSKALEAWLLRAEREQAAPSANVMLELAASARRVFDRVGRWIAEPNPSLRDIALSIHVQRVYAPRVPSGRRLLMSQGSFIHAVEYPDCGTVLAATASVEQIKLVAERLCRAANGIASRAQAPNMFALELLVPDTEIADADDIQEQVRAVLNECELHCRFTIALLGEGGDHIYRSFAPTGAKAENDGPPDGGRVEVLPNLLDIHPEIAERIDLQRFSAFELERLPSEEGIYCLYGRAREVEGDERVFVLADVQSSVAESREASVHMAAFERAFYQATRSLRGVLRLRDPRRRLQWNRIAISLAPEIVLDDELVNSLARRLAPATRHLGLEKVLVRVRLLDANNLDAPSVMREVVITEASGEQMEFAWRTPHRAPLHPAQEYERNVVAARSRRLIYPYEIIRMLTLDDRGRGASSIPMPDGSLPKGNFEEYDLDPDAEEPVAMSVAGRDYGKNEAGIVFGVISTPTGKVPEGIRRVLVLSDPNRGLGALAIPECDRIVAAIDLAERENIPVEWVPVSSGAAIKMDSGTENLDATARVVRRIVTFTQAGGAIHLIVSGVNIGAQSYFDALATMLMHTRGVLIMTPGGSMVLTGRAALEVAGSVSAEDEVAIGGFERIMGPNGQAQFYARNLAEAYRILYEYYRYGYVVPGESGPRRFTTTDPANRSICDYVMKEEESFDFRTVGEIFDDRSNPGRKKPFPMRAVMKALIDHDGGYLERWRSMAGGETAIVWDAHLGGTPISLIGIESYSVAREGYRPFDGPESWSGGTLFPISSKKVARAINAASGVRPLVILANLSGFDGSPESLRKLQLEYGAEIARAVVNFDGLIQFMVVSRYHGGAYVVFSQELNDSLHASALTGSFASVIGGGPAAAVVFAREVRARAVADPRVAEREKSIRRYDTPEAREDLTRLLADVTLEKQSELADEFDAIHTVERAREVGSLEKIVEPERMRAELIGGLLAARRDRAGGRNPLRDDEE